jgi:Bacterial archaeo-eukaryotic release factor family 7
MRQSISAMEMKGETWMNTIILRDRLSRDELRMMIEQPASPCASLFLRIERAEPAHQQNLLRLEHMIRQAEQSLLARGLNETAAHKLLSLAYQIITNRSFWANQGEGLAIFAADDLFRIYRLPLVFEDRVVVDVHAYITPLLPLLSGDNPFYVLALGLGGVRLFQGTQYGLKPVTLHDMPASLQSALAYDESAKEAQLHQSVPGQGGERGAIFHGQGAQDGTATKHEALRYFQQVARSVQHELRDEHAPLLLAGMAYLLPIYREANLYQQLIDEQISVNPDDLRLEELHARAWSLVAPCFNHAPKALERYQALQGKTPTIATSQLRAIIPAAYNGRVEALFLAIGQQQWGSFDPVSGALALHEGVSPRGSELLNQAVGQTLRHGGTVYAVNQQQMPEGAALAAILRY